MTRRELRHRMDNREFMEWKVYEQVEPFGEQREDFRAGILWSAFVTANCDVEKYPRGIGLEQYPLIKARVEAERPPLTPKSVFAGLKLLADATAAGKKVKDDHASRIPATRQAVQPASRGRKTRGSGKGR